jgi:hypothetical protein
LSKDGKSEEGDVYVAPLSEIKILSDGGVAVCGGGMLPRRSVFMELASGVWRARSKSTHSRVCLLAVLLKILS